jgi:hypothetical protein
MLKQIYNTQTKETTYEEFDETLVPQSEPTPIELTVEQRLDIIEPTLVTVVETIADIVGVV